MSIGDDPDLFMQQRDKHDDAAPRGRCPYCDHGRIYVETPGTQWFPCPDCDGTGRLGTPKTEDDINDYD